MKTKISHGFRLTLFGLLIVLPIFQAHADKNIMVNQNTAMVSAAHPLAVKAGMDILEKGGSATDAAIAVQAVLGLVEPQSSGLAGGGFFLHYDATADELTSWDGRETAPLAMTPDIFANRAGTMEGFVAAMTSPDAVGVPGIPALLETVHQKYGRLSWAELFTPAIGHAENGFNITPRLYYLLSTDPFLQHNAAARELYFISNKDVSATSSDGAADKAADEAANETKSKLKAKAIGTSLRNPAYADTLKSLAESGAQSFYTGKIGKKIIADLADLKAQQLLTSEDFASYQAKQRPNLCRPYRAYKVCSMGPPSSGGVTLLQILGVMSHFDMTTNPIGGDGFVHLMTEATRLAFADRAKYLGDSDFVEIPVTSLLDESYLRQRSQLIDLEQALQNISPGTFNHPQKATTYLSAPSTEQPSTTHFAIRDAQGNVVSMSSSVEAAFGSRIMSGGMFLNNQLTDFSFLPVVDGKLVANSVAPGKRPRSSMTPVIIFNQDGSFFAAIGSPGGPKIISYVAQTVIALLDYDLTMQEAINLPRHVTTGKALELEAETPLTKLKPRLEAMGHKVVLKRQHSGLHGIRLNKNQATEIIDGGADPRREGRVLTR
jgi:gamma-glutamyltranspeptidase/glutathione hydrolase